MKRLKKWFRAGILGFCYYIEIMSSPAADADDTIGLLGASVAVGGVCLLLGLLLGAISVCIRGGGSRTAAPAPAPAPAPATTSGSFVFHPDSSMCIGLRKV